MTTAAPRFFCADASRLRREPLCGTAPRVDTWLIIEHPAAWSAKGFPDDRFTPEIREHLARLRRRIPRSRMLLIRRSHVPRPPLSLFVAQVAEHASTIRRFSLDSHADLLGYGAPALLDATAGQSHAEPLFLVCTHGKHDKCCAKFGRATSCSLRHQLPGAVWECTHVGGDRFAANVLAITHGIYYGHVQTADATTLVEAERAGELSLEHYRGRCCFDRVVQAAEYFIRRESGILRIAGLTFLSSTPQPHHHFAVQFQDNAGRIHHAHLREREAGPLALLTCTAHVEQRPRHFELVEYRVAEPSC